MQDGVQAAIESFLGQHGGPALRELAITEYVQVFSRRASALEPAANAMASAPVMMVTAAVLVAVAAAG